MPRARRKAAGTRTKPKLPEGDEGANLQPDQRQKKKDTLIRDFNLEVERRQQEMQNMYEEMLQKVEMACITELCRIPEEIRKMEVTEFYRRGGTIDAASMSKAMNVISEAMASSSQSTLNSIPEEKSENTGTVKVKKGRTRKKRTNDVVAPAVTRSTKKLVTPLHPTMSTQALYQQTPLFTPKFDPRLPVTPGMDRVPKPGERLMSMEGSPVKSNITSHIKNSLHQVSLMNQQELTNLERDLETDAERAVLRELQRAIGGLFKQKAEM